MAFNTKLNFGCAKFYQCSGDTISLSGSTSLGTAQYLTDVSGSFSALSVVTKQYSDNCDTAASGTSLNQANAYTDTVSAQASGTSLNQANAYTDTCATAICSYADTTAAQASGTSLNQSNAYTDTISAQASGTSLNQANAYTDTTAGEASGTSLNQANAYTDTCATAICSYADTTAAQASGTSLNQSNAYTDTISAQASGTSLNQANAYTDTCATAICSYADTTAAQASGTSLNQSNAYTDTCATSICSYADTTAAQASGTSLNQSNAYTDTCVSNCTITANNGLHKTGTVVSMGGALTGNTSITGSYTLSANVTALELTGATTNLGGCVSLKTTPSGTGTLLCRDATTGQVKLTSLAAFGGITGATNGLTDCGSQRIGLGGALCAATCITGAYSMAVCDTNGVCLSTLNTNNIALNSKSNGGVVLKAQSGTVESVTDKANSVGIQLDFNDAFIVWDCRAGSAAVGIQYNDDYSTNYCDRSLVDKAYVDSIATGLQAHGETLVATTANIVLSGLTIVDGVQLTAADRVLVKDQTLDWQNGIYSATTGVWGRTSDYDFTPAGEIANGDLVPVTSGVTNGSSIFIQIEPDPIVSGDSINFSQFSRLIDVTGGEGIAVTIAGTNRSVAVDLATNSGLAFTGSKLCFDNTCLTSGLTSTGTGVVTVNASNCGAIGSCIPVLFDSNCFLVVDSDDFSYTTANNGLHKEGCNVVLGGPLTGATLITVASDTCSLKFTDTAGTKLGIQYSADYSAGFAGNSLITKTYSDNCDTAASGTSLNQANAYTDTVAAQASGTSLNQANAYTDTVSAQASGTSLNQANAYTDTCATAICSYADTTAAQASGTSLNQANAYTDTCATALCSYTDTVAAQASGTSLNQSNAYTDTISAQASGTSLNQANAYTDTCATAICSYADTTAAQASGTSLNQSNAYTDTCVAACTITAGNGLTKLTNNITLGGTLTGATNICTDGNKLVVGGSAANVTYFCNQESGGLTGWTTQACGGAFKTRYDSIVGATFGAQHTIQAVNNTGSTTCGEIRVCEDHLQLFIRTGSTVSQLQIRYADNVFTDGFNQKGLTYGGAYESNFTDLSLVTKCYVDGASGAIGGANGLSRQTDNIVLGGALTGNTSLTGAYDLGFTHTNFNVTAAVCVTGALNTSTTATIGGALTLSSVAAGSASDSVLTITAGGVVQKISSSSLGEDNNRYVIDVVTGNTTLPTTGYTILVSGATSLTLPSGVNGMAYKIKDACGNALAAPITIVGTIDGSANASINTDYGALELAYSSTLVEWYSLAFIN